MKFILSTFIFLLLSVNNIQAQNVYNEYLDKGELKLPSNVYYGIHTAQNMKHYTISQEQMGDYPYLIKGMGMVKLAAAKANVDAGLLDKNILTYIEKATQSLIYGGKRDQFELDAFQGDAAESINMATNEIIANAALEMKGLAKGDYKEIDPIADIGLGQDAHANFATAANIALVLQNEDLIKVLEEFVLALEAKSAGLQNKKGTDNSGSSLKFDAFANEIGGDIAQLQLTISQLKIHFMGISFDGKKNNPEFSMACSKYLDEISKNTFSLSTDQFGLTRNLQSTSLYSSALRSLASTLSRLSSYLILVSTQSENGPSALLLPKLPTETSKPGSTNILSLNLQVCATVIGNEATTSASLLMGQLPEISKQSLLAKSILESQALLHTSVTLLSKHCIEGISLSK